MWEKNCRKNGVLKQDNNVLAIHNRYNNTCTWNFAELTVFSCNFERNNLCGISQSGNDDMDWTLIRGSTPSLNTGPDVDHTLGTSKGKFVILFLPNHAQSCTAFMVMFHKSVYRIIGFD